MQDKEEDKPTPEPEEPRVFELKRYHPYSSPCMIDTL
jgi:hypothetical protein